MVEILDARFHKRLEIADTDIIDKHINVTPQVKHTLHTFFQRFRIYDIERIKPRPECLGSTCSRCRVTVAERHLTSGVTERLHDSPADT